MYNFVHHVGKLALVQDKFKRPIYYYRQPQAEKKDGEYEEPEKNKQ